MTTFSGIPSPWNKQGFAFKAHLVTFVTSILGRNLGGCNIRIMFNGNFK